MIALTGTPGVGKTSVATALSEIYKIFSVEELAEKFECIMGEEISEGGTTLIIDIEELYEKLESVKEEFQNSIVEGHLSHNLPADLIVVLRCNPIVLEKRLESKGWSEEKIRENIQAEILDVILVEALESNRKVYEIDTTEKSVKEVANILVELIEAEKRGAVIENFKPGKIDWISFLGERVDDFLI